LKKSIKNFIRHKKEILFIVVLFTLFLVTRLYHLSQTAIYPDEITWMVRGKETALAIKTRNFKYFDTAWWTSGADTEAIAIPLSVISGFPLIYLGKGQSVVTRNVFQDYIVARGAVIIFSAFFIVAYYLFIKKISDRKVASFSSLLLLFDPVFTANTKIVMNDIFITAFTFVSLSSYLLVKDRKLSIVISSLTAAAAFLTKPDGLIVFPVFFLQIFLNYKKWGGELTKFLWTGFLSFIFISIFWPASWHNFLLAIPEYIFRETTLVGNGINNYFFGQLTNNPPAYYYLFELLVRTPPIVIFGLSIFIYLCFTKKETNGFKDRISIFVFILLFLASISFSAKKLGVRYELPIWPWIYALSSYAIIWIIGKIKTFWLRTVVVMGIFAWFVFIFISLFPYHDLYYNFSIGGSANARNYDLVGLCEGSKGGVDYVLRCFPEIHLIAALGCGSSTIPYYYPYAFNEDWKNQKLFIVESYYIQLKKDPELDNFVTKNLPTYTFSPSGVDLAYVYAKPGVVNGCVNGVR